MEKPTTILGNAIQNTLVLLMPTKARDQGQKELDTNLIKITSLRKGWNLWLMTVLLHKWHLTKVTNKKEVVEEARNKAEKFIFRHWWIFVVTRIRSCNFNIRKTNAGPYSEVTSWTVFQDHNQCLLNKDHQHLKWPPQKSWISFQGFQDV